MRRLVFVVTTAALCLGTTACNRRHPGPDDLENTHAALTGSLPYPVLSWKPITTSVDRGQQLTATLYGNDVAVSAARAGQSTYPSGAVLGLVTWHEREDPHWFGGRIAGQPASVEFVEFKGGNPVYRRFTGQSMAEEPGASAEGRVAEITAMKAAYLP